MLFSILIPMYNAELYIEECINSVIKQSEKSFELIIINDGSTDCSGIIAEKFASKDSRVKLIHQTNRGLFHTRCAAIEMSKGEYIVFLDADDSLKKNTLSKLKEEFKDPLLDMVIYRAESFYESGKRVVHKTEFDENSIFEGETKSKLYKKILCGTGINAMWKKAIRKSCFNVEKYNEYPKITMSEDLLHSLVPLTNARKVKYITDVLYNYRIVNTSMTRNFDPDVFKWVKFVHEEIFKYLATWEMDTVASTQLFYQRFLKGIGSIVLFSPSNIKGKKEVYKKMLSFIKNDDLFLVAYNEAYSNLPYIYKIPVMLISEGRYETLFKLKTVIKKLR